MKKLFCVLIVALFCVFPVAACGGGAEFDVPEYPDNVRMDIGACFGPPVSDWHGCSPDVFNQERFNEMADAGFNMLQPDGWLDGTRGDGYNIARCMEMLGYAQNAGIGVLIGDENLSPYRYENIKFSANFEQYIIHSAVLGNTLCDEPSPDEFEKLADLYAKYKERSGKSGFINLYPSYYNIAAVGGNYENYVESFMETVKPGMLSYDYYPLLKDVREDGSVKVRDSYFTDMEIIRHAAKKYGVPVHNYIQASEHSDYPVLTEAGFRWQIAVNQAFGITSFTYFTYWTPNVAGYDSALINLDGTVSEMYGRAKTANREALEWDHVYLRYEWRGTAAVGGANGDPYGLFYGLRHADYEDGIEGIKSIASTEDVLCGMFKDADGNKGFMLTNATNPYDGKAASVTVRFDKEYKGAQVFEKGISRVINLDKSGKAVIKLEAGEGKFLIPLKKVLR